MSLAWRLHGRAVITSLVLAGCAVVPLVVAAIELPGIARGFSPRWWAAAAPSSYGPHWPDLGLQALWMLIAASVGVPLAGRDLAQGTARFAWTQGLSRGRWLLRTLLPVAGVLAAAALVFGLVFNWFFGAYRLAIGRWTAFELFPPALAGWTLAGLALGLLAGVVLRRSSRGLAAALVGYWVLDTVVSRYLRPHYLAPVAGPEPRGLARVMVLPVSPGPGGAWSYQPDSRFWAFQFIELGLLLAVAVVCTGLTYWLISGARVPGVTPRWRFPAAWGQHSRGLTAALAVCAATVVILVVTGLRLHARWGPVEDLWEPELVLLLPLVLGAFLGGPLVARDIMQGTTRFAWTQGVTRQRWVTGRLLRVGVPLAAGALAVSLLVPWWAGPLPIDRLNSNLFSVYPPVYVGLMLLGLTLGALLGAALGNVTDAIVLTIAAMLAAITFATPAGGFSPLLGNQPADRFWPLQAGTAAGLLAVSVLLAMATIGLVRRRSA